MKRKLLAVIMSALCIATAIPMIPVLADGRKVVTLGSDLSEDQRQAILRYFGVAGQNVEVIYVTNQEEREHLGSYVPEEQIGWHTYSCSFINPTNSGGIQVKTANLTWVTSNMIATTLSTSGVVNCEVLAAAPFEVSGTGALTGILKAYEHSVGQLDEAKKEVATQELVTTTTIANNIGQIQATEIVNETKIQVIEGNVVSDSDIDIIINEVSEQEDIYLNEADRAMLAELLREIAKQDYEYEDMRATLERVEQNMNQLMNQQNAAAEVSAQTEAPADSGTEQIETPETLPADSILNATDDSALGDSVAFDATDNSALQETEAPAKTEASIGFEISSSDSYSDQTEAQTQPEVPAEPVPDITIEPEVPGDVTPDITIEPDISAELTPDSNNEAEVPAVGEGTVDIAPEDDGYVIDDLMFAPGEEPLIGEVPEGDVLAAPILEAITVSDMEFAPISEFDELLPAGINELTICFQRDDIVAGTGSVTLHEADGSIVETIETNDISKVSFESLDSDERWNEGNKAVIHLSSPLTQTSSYYVTMTEDAFSSSDGAAYSVAIEDNITWTIQTSEYGVSIDNKNRSAGNMISGQIMIDGIAATYALIENTDPVMVYFDQVEFYESGSFSVVLMGSGETSFQVSFYDEAGSLLNTIDYTLNIK